MLLLQLVTSCVSWALKQDGKCRNEEFDLAHIMVLAKANSTEEPQPHLFTASHLSSVPDALQRLHAAEVRKIRTYYNEYVQM